MGYTLTPYSVDLEKMSSKVRTGDTAVFDKMMKKHAEDLESYQEYLDDSFESNDDDDNGGGGGILGAIKSLFGKKKAEEPARSEQVGAAASEPISAEQALRHMTVGGDFVPYGGTAYGYMFEWLCEEFGSMLSNEYWSSMRSGSRWMSQMDSALRKNGVDPSVFSIDKNLTAGDNPFGFPPAYDFPGIGYLKPEECKRLAGIFEGLDFQKIGDATEAPEHAVKGLEELRKWFATCAESNRVLVTFYY